MIKKIIKPELAKILEQEEAIDRLAEGYSLLIDQEVARLRKKYKLSNEDANFLIEYLIEGGDTK